MFREKTISTKILSVVIVSLFLAMLFPSLTFARDGEFELNCPYWYMRLDSAGYMDITYWYYSPRHSIQQYGLTYHEMMTGDWAAAVHYDGINSGSNQAQWLTDQFIWPTFGTGSPFDFNDYNVSNKTCNPVWTDANQPSPPPYNPTNKYDSGWSTIDDNKLEVKIYYEVVDLGEQDSNGVGGSPLAFRDANGAPVFVYSERYVLLQTYVFKNIHQTEDINNIEFYQMLHGHPGTHSSNSLISQEMHETANYPDPLASYTPCDPNHQTGANFRYDITLWNTSEVVTGHKDWMSFSSTIEPDDYGLDYFVSQGSYMESAVRNRNLNDANNFSGTDIAGAMMWNLGDLAPGESKSITLALMYGVGPIQTEPPLSECVTLTKTDDINDCVEPSIDGFIDNYINYDICYSTTCGANDVNLIDYLPVEVDYYSSTPAGDYNSIAHTVTWPIGDLDVNESNCVTLTVRVSSSAAIGSTIINTSKMYSGQTLIAIAKEDTSVCCSDTAVYVDDGANGSNNGVNWANAYTDLQVALADVDAGQHLCADQIWVAAGTYYPTDDANITTATFQMLDGIDIYGGFEGWETSIAQRDLADVNNETILSGDIGDNDTNDIDTIVTCANNARIDGFTITKSSYNSSTWPGVVYCDNVSTTIANCKIKDNGNYGIMCYLDGTDPNRNISVLNCEIENNGNYNAGKGIYCHTYLEEQSGTLNILIDQCTISLNAGYGIDFRNNVDAEITNSIISDNWGSGINACGMKLTVTDCNIVHNGYGGSGGQGIYARNTDEDLIVKYNIVKDNYSDGITAWTSNAEISNNLVCNNNGNGIMARTGDIDVINNLIYRNDSYGIYVISPGTVNVRNNTIAYNDSYGIISAYPTPVISNCIIWDNGYGSLNGTFTNVNYNCIENYTGGGTGNDSNNPQFRDADANDYHLLADSNCIDTGNPNFTPDANETDIDGEARVMLDEVDMGADEFYYSRADYNADEIVNFIDYSIFANSWQTINAAISLDDDSDVALDDLGLFCADWLWQAGWTLPMFGRGGGAGANFERSMFVLPEYSLASGAKSAFVIDIEAIKEILEWLDKLWYSGELEKTMTEKEYLEFRKAIESVLF